ncbi:MAG: M3 family oligoendopeptidase, partial [Clostridiales bacterium]|nr:M3 family oligoendopeptidase [Clostridiales bacterium]
LTMARLKKYDSPADWMLDESRVDRPTLDALILAMTESLPAFRRYFRAKAAALGHPNGLPFYDLFAPLGASSATYTLDEARQVLEKALGAFSPELAAFVGRAFDEKWIDAYPRPGKQGGAFCAGAHPLGISYILTNFDGSFSSVSTLAHELGHAFHNECLKGNSILNADYPMPLAETASIFNETLLTGALMEELSGDALVPILEQQICDAAQVVVDILSRYLFETRVFEIRKQRPLPARELKELMLTAQRDTYGDGLDGRFLHPYMWACKGHYYSPDLHFYNHPYAFGLLFGKGVYAQYLRRGPAFVPEYKKLLRATAVGDAADVAASVGIDVRNPAFWREALQGIERDIDRLIELL